MFDFWKRFTIENIWTIGEIKNIIRLFPEFSKFCLIEGILELKRHVINKKGVVFLGWYTFF